jgi:hypothetical protein
MFCNLTPQPVQPSVDKEKLVPDQRLHAYDLIALCYLPAKCQRIVLVNKVPFTRHNKVAEPHIKADGAELHINTL